MAEYCPNCGAEMNPNCSYCDSLAAESEKKATAAQWRKKLIIRAVSALAVILFAGLGISSLLGRMNDPEANYNNGEAYLKEGKHDKAIKSYTTAIQLKPDHLAALCGRGKAHTEKGDYDKAMLDYTVAIKIKPLYVDALVGRGHVYSKKKNYKAAIADYSLANGLKPGNFDVLMNRAAAYRSIGDDNRAIADYEMILKVNPNNTGVKQILESLRKKQKTSTPQKK